MQTCTLELNSCEPHIDNLLHLVIHQKKGDILSSGTYASQRTQRPPSCPIVSPADWGINTILLCLVLFLGTVIYYESLRCRKYSKILYIYNYISR